MAPVFMLGVRLRGLMGELENENLVDSQRYDRFAAVVRDFTDERLIAEREGAIAILSAALAFGNPTVTRQAMAEAMAAGLSSADIGRVNKIVTGVKVSRSAPTKEVGAGTRSTPCC